MNCKTICAVVALLAFGGAAAAPIPAIAAAAPIAENAEKALEGVGIIDIIGVRANSTAPFFIKGMPFGGGVWQPLTSPVYGGASAAVPPVPQFGFGGATCNPEYSRAQIVTADGSTLVYNLVGTHCLQPSGAATTNGLYDIVSGTGRFADYAPGGGIFSIDEIADGQAFLALSGMHCPCRK